MVLSIIAAISLSQQPTVDSLYTAYRKKIAGLQSATGIVSVDMIGGPVRYDFKIRKPKSFVVASAKQQFICNGEKVWQYMPETGQYNEPPIEHYGKGPLLQPFLPFFEGVEAK